MARRAFGQASIPLVEQHAMMLIRHVLQQDDPRTFNASALRYEIGGPLRDAPPIEAACRALCDAGIARKITPARRGRGRPRLDYEVNPIVIDGETGNLKP